VNDATGSQYAYSQGDKTKPILKLPGSVQLTGWPTPCVVEPDTHPDKVWERKQRLSEATGIYRGNDCGLGSKVNLAGWATPDAGCWNVNSDLTTTQARRDRLKEKHGNSNGAGMVIATQALLTANGPARLTASGEMLTGSAARMESGGQLHPEHSLWLQLGPFATAWALCAGRVTRSTSRKPRASSKR
jgi:hypothetical protein